MVREEVFGRARTTPGAFAVGRCLRHGCSLAVCEAEGKHDGDGDGGDGRGVESSAPLSAERTEECGWPRLGVVSGGGRGSGGSGRGGGVEGDWRTAAATAGQEAVARGRTNASANS